MSPRLQPFLVRANPTLRVFCPEPQAVLTSFESYLPEFSTIRNVTEPSLPRGPCWVNEAFDHHAFLPKDRRFPGHLLTPLNYHNPLFIQRDGRWYADDQTRNLWRSLDNNITNSIGVVGGGLLVALEHREPRAAFKYGFAHGHESKQKLSLSLALSKDALVHRLAYLTYLVSLRYQWDRDLVDQEWWKDFTKRFPPTWVDSVWGAIHLQWHARNFVGVVVKPSTSSVRWLKPALNFGVPIWVSFPDPEAYDGIDGGFVVNDWKPTKEQVRASRMDKMAKFAVSNTASIAASSSSQVEMDISSDAEDDPTPLPPTNLRPEPPTNSETPSPPAKLPPGTTWHLSWDQFFQNRDLAYEKRLETATEKMRQSWESLALNAKSYSSPGRKGARVYIWEVCDSGGFLRILQSRHEAAQGWAHYYNEALRFYPPHNSWDYCEFSWQPAVESGPPDDLDDEDGREIMEPWYPVPESPPTLPDPDPQPLEYLYQRYGFLSVEPMFPPEPIIHFDKPTAYRIVGLEAQNAADPPEHLNSFITSILKGRIPTGHCDLCSSSPTNEEFSHKTLIHNSVYRMALRTSEEVFAFLNTPGDPLILAMHEPLSLLQMMRVETDFQLGAQLLFLVENGSRFTLLYPETRPSAPLESKLLPSPIRNVGWQPNSEDFRAYMSRLATFFLERPYVAAAAFSRGGIAGRIAREVLGIEGSVKTLLETYPDQRCSVATSRGPHWYHELDRDEWYYLVGGYEVLTGTWVLFAELHRPYPQTGKGDQRQELSWWPKITTWEGSGADHGCWSPMCERWFRKRLESLRSGTARPYSSSAWAKNLRYAKETKNFIQTLDHIGRNFLAEDCTIQNWLNRGHRTRSFPIRS